MSVDGNADAHMDSEGTPINSLNAFGSSMYKLLG
jgi:hypothetical protein